MTGPPTIGPTQYDPDDYVSDWRIPMREDIECQCFFCQGFPQNFTQEEIHQAAQELAAMQQGNEETED